MGPLDAAQPNGKCTAGTPDSEQGSIPYEQKSLYKRAGIGWLYSLQENIGR